MTAMAFDITDSDASFFKKVIILLRKFGDFLVKIVKWVSLMIKGEPLLAVLNALALGLGMFFRLYYPVTRAGFTTSDAYLHLAWIKYLGASHIYQDGIYPSGMHAVVGFLSKIYMTDPYYMVRYLGPVVGFMIMLSIYFFVSRNYKRNRFAPWLAVMVYVGVTSLPTTSWRQSALLPQEYALVFLLPVLHYFNQYLKKGEVQHLRIAAMGLACSLLTHLYAPVFILAGCLLILLLNGRTIRLAQLGNVLGYGLLAIALALAPIGVALARGMTFHRSMGFVKESISLFGGEGLLPGSFWSGDVVLIIGLVCSLLLVLKSLGKNERDGTMLCFVGIMGLIMLLLYRGSAFGFPMIMLPDRLGVFLSIYLAPAIGIAPYMMIFGTSFRTRRLRSLGISVILLGAVLLSHDFQDYKVGFTLYEYDQAVKNYISIRDQHLKQTWTIIGPTEQYQQTVDNGYHYQLWKLMELQETSASGEKLEIPTPDIFIFVEKIPLYGTEHVSLETAKKAFPKVSGDLSEFYIKPENRAIIEAKAWYWAEAFRNNNPDFSIYYDDEQLRVYHLKQEGKPLNLITGMPKEVLE